jgi:hypothetical protein
MKKLLIMSCRGVLLIMITVFLAGCGLTKTQKTGIATFGQAAATMGTAGKEGFQGGRDNVIEMKGLRLAIERKTLPAAKPDGKPDRAFYAEELNLDAGLDPDNIDKRVHAMELLSEYGNLLVAFSGETRDKELTAAADKFTKSVKTFPGNPLSADEIDGLGKVVVVAGKMWIESEKKEALKKIIPTVSPLIKKLCGDLEADFDPQKNGVAADIYNAQDRLANEAIDGLKRTGDSMSDRLLLIHGFALADRNKAALEATSINLLKAVASLRQANDKLVSLIGDNKITLDEIKAFADDAGDLAKAVKPFLH